MFPGNERKGSPAYKKWKNLLHVKESFGRTTTVQLALMGDRGKRSVCYFQRSLSHRSVRYTSYIGDGDSKTFSHLLLHPIRIEKISQFQKTECVGHVRQKKWEPVHEN
ncbi:hypothetical protein TNCV_649821 [Trichonephila clavipes]|nr:hypothetical protein TNCV_649821 [Trichonephila clavipes]